MRKFKHPCSAISTENWLKRIERYQLRGGSRQWDCQRKRFIYSLTTKEDIKLNYSESFLLKTRGRKKESGLIDLRSFEE